MKNTIRLIFVLLMTMMITTLVVSGENKLSVTVDGKEVKYEAGDAPYITQKGNAMVSLNPTMTALGAEVSYSNEKREITVKKGSNSVIVPIEKQYIGLEGKKLVLKEATVTINGRAMVEIVPIIQSLRCTVVFDSSSNTIKIESIPTYELLPLVDEVPPWAENPNLQVSVDENKVQGGKKLVALTYDDGPNGKSTEIILDVLKANNAKATFFMVGKNVYAYKAQAIRTVNEGHEVANHSYSHPDLSKMGSAGVQKEIQNTQEAIKSVTGATSNLLRVPYGAYNSTVKNVAGLPIVLWNIDTLDWKTRSAQKTINSVLNNVKDGDVVLMHNIHMSTAEASKVIIPELIKRGYTLVTVSELAEARGIKLQNGGVYNSFKK